MDETTPLPWRTGRKVGRTIYGPPDAANSEGRLIGVMDRPEDADLVVRAVNASGPVLPDASGEVAGDGVNARAASALFRELRYVVLFMEPLERDGRLQVPGLATLNGARMALHGANPHWRRDG